MAKKRGKTMGSRGSRRGGSGGPAGTLAKLPRDADACWSVVILRPSPEIDPAEIYEVALVLDERMGVRRLMHGLRPLGLDAAAAVLQGAMLQPLAPHRPARPGAVATRPEFAEAIAPVAALAGAELRLDAELDIAAELLAYGADNGIRLTDRTFLGLATAQEPAFAEAAAAYARVSPWDHVGDELVYELPDTAVPTAFRFGIVIGSMRETFGLALYRSLADIGQIESLSDEDGAGPPCVTAFFGSDEELSRTFVMAYARRGHVLANRRYPMCVYVEGFGQRDLHEAEAETVTIALRVLADHFARAVTGAGYVPGESDTVQVDGRAIALRIHERQTEPDPPPYYAARRRSHRAISVPESPFRPGERFVFEVSLNGVTPRIWRRFAIPTDATFQDLHMAIQLATDWEDDHLYAFATGSGRKRQVFAYGSPPLAYPPDDPDVPDAADLPLHAFFCDRRARRCEYRYDFGDDWQVTVQMSSVQEGEAKRREFLDGARAFPKDNAGGLPGYFSDVEEVTEAGGDPERLEWLGDWNPESCDHARLTEAFEEWHKRARG